MSKLPSPDDHFPVACKPSAFINDLDPPIYSNPILDVVGADRGLGLRHVDPYLLVTLSRWTGLQEGDTYEYYHGSRTVALASDFVRPGETGNSFFRLAIEQERVPQDSSFPVFVRVVRNGPGTSRTSDDLTVFVKETRPGLDEQPGLGYHNRLLLSLPADLAMPGAVLTPERAALGVLITLDYPGKRVRDKVSLYWDTIAQVVVFELDEDHASGAKPIEVTVPPNTIGTGSGLIPIRYQVFDEVQNRSGHVEHFSQAVHVQAELDPNLLERAYFQINFVDATSVNYDEDAGSNFRIEVVAPRRLPNGSSTPTNARVLVTLSGTVDGVPVLTQDLPDAAANPGRSSFFNVDDDIIKQLIKGTMVITWRLEFPLGTVLASSQSLTILISGTIASMPAVTVRQADAGLVDPNEPFITIDYPNPAYSPYDPNNLVTLRMEALLPGGGIVEYEQPHLAGAPPPPTRFRTVTQANFARFVGLGDVRIFYKVNDGLMRILGAGTEAIRESDSTFVQFGPRLAEMPRPEIDRVDEDDNLDPNDLFGQLDITLPYDRTNPDDIFEWRLIGTAADGSTSDRIVLNRATAGSPVSFSLDRHYADTNQGGIIRLSYSLIPANGGRTLRSEILEVTVGKAVGDLPRPEVLEASKAPDQLAPEAATAGATIRVTFPQMLPSDRIRACWTGIPDIGSHCETKDGDIRKTVDFTVPPEVVGANIAPFGQQVTVQYFLIRSGREKASPILDLLLLNLTTLPIPTIEGIGDAPLLDLSRLNGTERTAINTWHFIHKDERIWMEYRGTYATDPESEFFEATYTNNLVTPDGVNNGILPPTPVDELRKLKDGSTLTISFWVSFDRSSNKANAVLFRQRTYIIQALPGVLPHPFINGTTDTGPNVAVDPLPLEHNTTVTVRYTGMSGRDFITLVWTFADGSSHSVGLPGLDGGTVVFNLTADKVLHRSVYSTVCLKYSVARTGVPDPIPSQVQTVWVNAIPVEDLPQPLINNVIDGGTLDLGSFTGDAKGSVSKWPLSDKDQLTWMVLSAEGIEDLPVFEAKAISATEAANGLKDQAVLRSWLARVLNNSQITVSFWVAYNRINDKSRAVEFPTTTYSIAYEPLSIDTSTLVLNGWHFNSTGANQIADFPGAAFARQPKGGVAPYYYSIQPQSYPAAVIDNSGNVRSRRNGSTRVTVSDSAGAQVSYPVTVSNCWDLYILAGDVYPFGHHNFLERVQLPYEQIPESRWSSIYTAYGRVPIRWNGDTQLAWITSVVEGGRSKSYNGNTGATQSVSVNENIRHALCVVPSQAS